MITAISRALAVIGVAASLASTGCFSSGYQPRGPGVAVKLESNKIVYVRDGRSYERGSFGDGLRDAVRGNPEAERAATRYSSGLKRGVAGVVLGMAGILSGTVYTLSRAIHEGDQVPNRDRVISGSLFAAGAVFLTWGAFEIGHARAAEFDAINIFNDSRIGTFACSDPKLRNCPMVPALLPGRLGERALK